LPVAVPGEGPLERSGGPSFAEVTHRRWILWFTSRFLGSFMASAPRRALACAAVLALTGLAPAVGHAGSVYGSAAIITNRPCLAAPADLCVVNGVPRNFTQFAGGMFTSFDTSAPVMPGGASGAAGVSFGDGYLPTVRVGTTAGAATRTGATAVAFRSFTYTGADTIDLALNGVLHNVNSGDALEGDGFVEGNFNVALSLLRVSDLNIFSPSSTANDISSSPIGFRDRSDGAIAASGYQSLGKGAGEHTGVIVGLSQACTGHALTLHTGDDFVVVAALQAISNRGGFIDDMHTFSVQVDAEHTYLTGTTQVVDPVVLTQSLNGAVREPASWVLMILGFGLTRAALRRR
jgi:hypothetical protein